ncbi:MAG: fused response regulator/phosphatase [Magnetococcales bacterium]|nr:fused response regulator/phosphatase [Magnetococcales bacterium]
MPNPITRPVEPRILIVEDSPSLALAMQRFIRSRLGLHSDIAPSLMATRTLLNQMGNGYTLAILDLTLPDAGREQIVAEISQRRLPSIIFSGEYDETLRAELLNHYIIDFVIKKDPSSLTYMLQLIKRILKNQSIKVLVVDDSGSARHKATQLLTTYQFTVLEAANGREALDILDVEHDIKLIIADYYMPDMNGDELTAKVRTLFTKESMAIIGLSSEQEQPLTARFLKAGANDFIRKPYQPEEFFCRITQNLDSQEQLEEIRKHHDLLAREREIIETILTRMRTSGRFDDHKLRFLMEPVEKTNGDLLLAARRPDGTQHVLLGDFTGHGLQAALGGPMVTELFYDMTEQNRPLEQIANEINRKITIAMPTDMFLAAAFVEINPQRTQLTAWNCSVPDIMIYRNRQLWQRIPSENLPRGIRDQPVKPGFIQELLPGDRIFLFSDGIIEEMDPGNKPFDYQGIQSFLTRLLSEDTTLENIIIILENHRHGFEQQDDITLVEITA